MKLGLIASESVKQSVESACSLYEVKFFEIADLYLVEYGFESDYTPCYVFRPQEISQMMHMLELTGIIYKKSAYQLAQGVQEYQEGRGEGLTEHMLQVIGMKDETWHVIKLEDILFFEARESAVFFYSQKSYYRMNEKLYEAEKRLPRQSFIRISRSYIVNIQRVATIAPWFSRRLLLTFDNTEVTVEVSRNYVQAFKEFLGMR